MPHWLSILALGTTAILAFGRDLNLISVNLPEARRQVPRSIFQKPIMEAAIQFGFEMGTGARTYLTSSTPYVAAVAVFLFAPSYAAAAITGVGFGAGRAGMPLARWASGLGQLWDENLTHYWKPIALGTLAQSIFASAVLLSLRS